MIIFHMMTQRRTVPKLFITLLTRKVKYFQVAHLDVILKFDLFSESSLAGLAFERFVFRVGSVHVCYQAGSGGRVTFEATVLAVVSVRDYHMTFE